MEYSALAPGDSVEELVARICTALEGWDVNQEMIVRHTVAKLAPFDFKCIMQWYFVPRFSVRTTDDVRVSTSSKWLSVGLMINDPGGRISEALRCYRKASGERASGTEHDS